MVATCAFSRLLVTGQDKALIASSRHVPARQSIWRDRRSIATAWTGITGAGCNALDYLLAGACRIDAVDCNPCQGYLLEWNVAAIRSVSYGDFFQIFGKGGWRKAPQVHRDAVRAALSPEARQFWDDHLYLLDGSGWRRTLYHKSTSGTIYCGLVQYLRRAKGLSCALDQLLAAKDLEDQREIYGLCEVRRRLDAAAFRWLLSQQPVLSLLAIPAAQRGIADEEYAGGWASFSLHAIDEVFHRTLIRHNPFWLVALTGSYTTDCHPSYLEPQGFERLKNGLLDRLHIHTATVTDYLASQDAEAFSKFVLLDHMDWMAQDGLGALTEEWAQILRTARPGARILFRSASASAQFLDRVRVGGSSVDSLRDFLRFDSDAEMLHQQDRVCI
jgi:S-adenosylmethionine-diacylglycerol 3-amino-3-carboxypropyl transferase